MPITLKSLFLSISRARMKINSDVFMTNFRMSTSWTNAQSKHKLTRWIILSDYVLFNQSENKACRLSIPWKMSAVDKVPDILARQSKVEAQTMVMGADKVDTRYFGKAYWIAIWTDAWLKRLALLWGSTSASWPALTIIIAQGHGWYSLIVFKDDHKWPSVSIFILVVRDRALMRWRS